MSRRINGRLPGWQDHEAHVQQVLGLDSTPGSGNQFNDQGDAVDRRHSLDAQFPILADCKMTEHVSASLKLKVLHDLEVTALTKGKRPALPVRFWPRGDFTGPHDYVVLRLEDLTDLLRMAGVLT